MIKIQAPDGAVVEFPDGTDDDTITKVMSAEYGAPKESAGIAATATDAAKSLGIGAAKGAVGLAGLPGDLQRIAKAGAEYVDPASKFFTSDPNMLLPSSADIQGKVEGVTGKFYEPQTTVGKYAQTVGEFAPGMLMGPGGIARKAATNVLLPAVGSEAAGQATEGTAAEPYARLFGAIGGAVAPSVAGRVVTPFPARRGINPDDVQMLRNEGIDVTAGQATGRTGLQRFEARSGGGRYEDIIDRQGEQFTSSALRRAGEDAQRATPEVMDRMINRVGQQFDDLAARNNAVIDQRFDQDLRGILTDYTNLVEQPNRIPAVENFAREIANHQQRHGGVLPGEVYQSLRSRMESAARGTSNNEARHTVREMRGALDDAMERSISQTNPSDLGGWQTARREYRNLLAVEQAATGAGADAARGIISPAQLSQAVKTKHGRRNYVRGQGDLADLSRAGVGVLTRPNTSGTAENLSSMNFAAMLGNLPMRGAARAALSGPGQRYLGNQLMTEPLQNLDPRSAAYIAALLSANQSKQLPAPQQ